MPALLIAYYCLADYNTQMLGYLLFNGAAMINVEAFAIVFNNLSIFITYLSLFSFVSIDF